MSERFPSSPINRNAVLRSYHSRNIPALGDPERHVHVAGEPDSLGNLYCACGASLGNPDLEALLEAEEAEEAFYSRQHVGQCSICGHLDHDASAHPAWIGWADERPTVVCAAGVHVWDRRDENAPIEASDPCKKCLYNRVLCEAHTGIHAERTDCRWPHYVAPSGPAPLVFDESGSLIETL